MSWNRRINRFWVATTLFVESSAGDLKKNLLPTAMPTFVSVWEMDWMLLPLFCVRWKLEKEMR